MKHQTLVSTLSSLALATAGACTSVHAVTFTPPPNGASPSQATGGGSRGQLFIPTAGNGAPKQTTGGASRGELFKPATGNGAPGQTTGGASRGDLFKPATGSGSPTQAAGGASRLGSYPLNPSPIAATGPAALIALLPQTFYGTTVAERPTFLVYLPTSNATEAVFSLKDDAGNIQHQMTLPVSGKVGVMTITLPSDAPALAVGKNYQWVLALKVDEKLTPSTPYVDGWVQRVQPNADLAAAMQHPDALTRAKALGKNGVWYDCVATLASVYATQPSNGTLADHWTELLSSVGLKEIVTAPVMAATP